MICYFQFGKGSYMCFDGKTQALAKRLKADILSKVDNVDQAREMIAEYKRTTRPSWRASSSSSAG